MSNTASMTAPSPYPRPAYAWYCLGVICFAYLFGFMDRIIVGLLTPAIQQDIGLSETQMGVIHGLPFALFYVLFSLPIGFAADRVNRKQLLAAGTALWSLMTAASGLARGFWGLFATRAGVGVGEATLNPCTTSLIGDYFRPEVRPRAFGIYTMSTALGTAATYLGGGAVLAFFGVGMGGGGRTSDIPLLGPIQGWQAVFIVVGLAGLVPALLMVLTVREPARRDIAGGLGQRAGWAETWRFFRPNLRTLLCHHFGVAFIVAPIYGMVNWVPTYFVRLHEVPVPTFSVWYGIGGGIAGTLSAITVGYFTGWLKNRGYADATYRTMLIGGIGISAGNAIAPLLPTPALAMAGFIVAGIFVNYTPSQALAAIAEITPNQLRGFVTSIYIMVVGIAGAGLGPLAFGLATDYIFADPMKIHYSMALVTLIMGVIGVALIAYGLKAFRASVSRATWSTG